MMENKRKQFRFPKPGKPELISFKKNKYIIQHPTGSDGVFLNALKANLVNTTEILINTATKYKGAKTKMEVIDIDRELFSLGQKVLSQKKNIKYKDLASAVNSLFGLDYDLSNRSGDLIDIWDGLFYQIVSGESEETYQAVIAMLIADHIVNNFGNIPSTNRGAIKWANSRVIVPNILKEYHSVCVLV